MDKPFNLTGIHRLYQTVTDQEEEGDRCLAFTIRSRVLNEGRDAIFGFIVFFSDKQTEHENEMLYIHFGHTAAFAEFKMYGNHDKGDYKIYCDKAEALFRAELGIAGGNAAFKLEACLRRLNSEIGKVDLDFTDKVETLRTFAQTHPNAVKNYVADADKIYLMGIRPVPRGETNPKTVRKLLIYTDANVALLERLIDRLIDKNLTTFWTDDPEKKGAIDLASWLTSNGTS